jgi:geranylgeranyl pyrophosphate synthase
MSSPVDRIEVFQNILEEYGRKAMEKAVVEILDSKYNCGSVSSALKYHAKFLRRVSPVFPALISLSCEAAGGRMEKTTSIGAALTLFVEAANLHDDIIDQTTTKYGRKTVFGKFGGDITLLAGEVLLVQGSVLLHRECNVLPAEQKNAILDWTFESLIEISNSVAMETKMRRKNDVKPQDYFEVIRLRAAVPEAHCKIGGLLGGGSEEVIGALGYYGRTYGVVGTIVDEFMDLLDHRKFGNRLRNECLPLPVMYALGNPKIQNELKSFIEHFDPAKKGNDEMVRLVSSSDEVQKLKKDAVLLAERTLKQISVIEANIAIGKLTSLLQIVTEILGTIG